MKAMQAMRPASLYALARRCATAASQSPSTPVNSNKKYRRKTLAEVAAYLPDDGVGARFTRLMWLRNRYDASFWTVTKVTRDRRGKQHFHGKLTWLGEEKGAEKLVNTQDKAGWRFIRDDTNININSSTTRAAE